MATRALFSRRSLLLPAAPAAALAALAGCSSSSASRSESAGPEAAPAGPEAAPAEFIGVFVSRESAAALKARFPARLAAAASSSAAADEPLFVVLKFHPTAAEREAFAPLMGRRAALQVAGYVEDARTQAVLVRVTTEDGEPIEFGDAAGPQLLALAAVDGAAGLNAGAASLLLERLRASDKLRFLLEDDGDDAADAEWTGELPAFDSKLLPLFNPFPAATVTLARAGDAPALSGTVCASTAFDPEQDACLAAPAKAECGFCKFMKAGPCGAEFSAWEACLDRCKAGGLDFIDHCGKETLALRDCVDANPEYYHVLHDGEDDAPAAEQPQPETATAE